MYTACSGIERNTAVAILLLFVLWGCSANVRPNNGKQMLLQDSIATKDDELSMLTELIRNEQTSHEIIEQNGKMFYLARYKSGNRFYVAPYPAGSAEGKIEIFYPDGPLAIEIVVRQHAIDTVKHWDRSGNLIQTVGVRPGTGKRGRSE